VAVVHGVILKPRRDSLTLYLFSTQRQRRALGFDDGPLHNSKYCHENGHYAVKVVVLSMTRVTDVLLYSTLSGLYVM